MIFFDFEVFKFNWLVVAIDPIKREEFVIHNNKDELVKLYELYKNDIWVGFNCRNYDVYILKAILLGFNPKEVNDFIIVQGKKGYQYSKLFNKIPLNAYDVYLGFNGLKTLEAFQGHSIYESDVDFDLDRPLTPAELAESIEYCRNDVMETINVFIEQKQEFDAKFALIKTFGLPLSNIEKTQAQLAAIILGAKKQTYNDEFDIRVPNNLMLGKYQFIADWFLNAKKATTEEMIANKLNYKDATEWSKYFYNRSLETEINGVPHKVALGGLHGAIPINYTCADDEYLIMADVDQLYPTLMVKYRLLSRSVSDYGKFEDILNTSLRLKAEKKKKEREPYKRICNITYGAEGDKYNAMYDPLHRTLVCVFGQLFLIDLLEKIEPHSILLQSNTDGILIKIKRSDFELIDDLIYEWEQRTGLHMSFDLYKSVYQKDVNNYIVVDYEGNAKSKGAYVKKLSKLDYDLPIVNKAVFDYIVKKKPVEDTINECDDLIEFQKIYKVSSKYAFATHNGKKLNGKVFRVFASTAMGDTYLGKCKSEGATNEKFGNCPESCFIDNGDVTNKKVNWKLDKQWYIDLSKKRIEDFGIKME